MANQLYYQWRVTKYNPAFRDENGYYTLIEEWTCPSEIGKIINGKEFTLEEYLQVEDSYVNAIVTFMEESGIDSLRIFQFSDRKIEEEDKTSALYETIFDEIKLKEDLLVSTAEIRIICKMILRNFADCGFYVKDRFFVNFGWDYYMYIGSSVPCSSAIKDVQNNGLFVENILSPYSFSEEETSRTIQWNEVDDEDKIIVGNEELIDVPLDEYQRVFELSPDHPVIGLFDIKREHMDFFQKYLKHRLDFDKYHYSFWGGY